jgi:coenzyme F420-reducing hydrogenase delta subunit
MPAVSLAPGFHLVCMPATAKAHNGGPLPMAAVHTCRRLLRVLCMGTVDRTFVLGRSFTDGKESVTLARVLVD